MAKRRNNRRGKTKAPADPVAAAVADAQLDPCEWQVDIRFGKSVFRAHGGHSAARSIAVEITHAPSGQRWRVSESGAFTKGERHHRALALLKATLTDIRQQRAK